ncbi:MAG: hypothetical protein H0X51_03875 [Parachlamydiaceae bacterium]|nr:hypothetical protein [Parachlamydiaceae bacterium]
MNINVYNRRQLKLMIEKIDRFKTKLLSLGSLINDLEALLDILEEMDSDWVASVRKHWLDLEIVYAVALADDREYLEDKDIVIIDEAITNILILIHKKLPPESEEDFEDQ